MNDVTTALLSPKLTQWNWNLCEDAKIIWLHGKTPCTFTTITYGFCSVKWLLIIGLPMTLSI